MITIVDYGMGNLRSVEKGFEKAGFSARVVRDAEAIRNASSLVLPGVGAFRDCMANLEKRQLTKAIVQHIQAGKPYLGICLGLHILFTESEEFGTHRGLDLIPGKVRRFRFDVSNESDGEKLKIPHMGWNTIHKNLSPPILHDVAEEDFLYFVHSYYVVPDDPSVIATTTRYGIDFTSMIWKENIFAVQFHPEKSQTTGLSILQRFGELAERSYT
ncbi:MAG: imidazole glycerol phosphate synthase subunit HisH [Deltaproteobacteria bacterium]|nr:imidazole glycerol phosphate synthase subunit HisH [Deltaproteobacteria bacterium]